MRMAMRVLGFANVFILVRLLAPEDFGLFAMASIVVGLAEVFAVTGVDQALIQRSNPDREDYATAWTLRLFIGLLVGIAVVLASAPMVAFYDDERVQPVMLVLAGLPIIRATENIWVIEYRRDLRFHKDFNQQVIARFIGIVIGIGLAFLLKSYWALVYGALVRAAMLSIVSYFIHSGRPHLTRSRLHLFLGFSSWSVFRALANTLSRMADRLVIGWSAGAEIVGSYAVASDIARIIGSEVAGPIGQTLQPGYAKIKDEPKRLATAFNISFGLAVLLATSLCFGISATSQTFVPFVLGEQWRSTIPILEVLGFASAFGLISNSTFTPLLITIGRHKELTIYRICIAAILVTVLFMISVGNGVKWVAWTMVATQSASVLIGAVIVRKYLPEIQWGPLFSILRGLIAGTVMYAVVAYCSDIAAVRGLANWQQLTVQVLAGRIVYVATLLIVWLLFGRPAGTETFILRHVRNSVRLFWK